MALYSFYLNGFKAAKQIKSFELISSMLKLIDLSLNPHEKKFIRYNKVPHLFLNRPITTEQFEYKKIISTKTGNILLIYSESFELFSPNHRLIKKEKMEFNWNGSIEFLNKEKFGIFSNLKIKIYETDSCSLIKEIPLSKDYKQYSYTIIDDDHVCLYSKKQAVILNINTKEESKIPLITNEYFTIRPLKKDSIILLSSSGFGIYNLITKECEKTFKYNENKIYVMFGFPINNINKIGIISFYKRQSTLINNKIIKIKDELKKYGVKVEVGTVDNFQGREFDLVILSCVRTEEITSFIKQIRRWNVAISRAKDKLITIGNFEKLNDIASKTIINKNESQEKKEIAVVFEKIIPNFYEKREKFSSIEEIVNEFLRGGNENE